MKLLTDSNLNSGAVRQQGYPLRHRAVQRENPRMRDRVRESQRAENQTGQQMKPKLLKYNLLSVEY